MHEESVHVGPWLCSEHTVKTQNQTGHEPRLQADPSLGWAQNPNCCICCASAQLVANSILGCREDPRIGCEDQEK